MPIFRKPHASLIAIVLVSFGPLHAEDRWAPAADARPVDQLVVSGNACGPAALLTAIRCGDGKWQALAARLPGESDKAKLLYIIRAHGLQPSSSLGPRRRWTREGINAADLIDVAGELAAIGSLPAPRGDELFLRRWESPPKLLKRLHGRCRNSLKSGLPPILSIRRHVLRDGNWVAVQGHFVTVIRVPEKIDRRARSFPVVCYDPWRGSKREGSIRIPSEPILSPDGQSSTCLEIQLPGANIGKRKVRKGERSALVPSLVIGRW